MSYWFAIAALSFCTAAVAQTHPPAPNAPPSVPSVPTALPEVLITGTLPALRQGPSGLLVPPPQAHTEPAQAHADASRLDEVLVNTGLATPGAAGAPDLSPTVQMRGFVTGTDPNNGLGVGRIYIGPHPDLLRRHVRDWATVEGVVVLQGPAATITGVGTPAGVLQYIPKTAGTQPHLRLHTSHDSTGLWRAAVDWQTPITTEADTPAHDRNTGSQPPSPSALSTRLVAASQRHGLSADGMPTDRDTLLWTSRWRGTHQHWDFTLEHQHNQQPFGFGTLYTGGKFRFDQAYVDRSRSQASRSAQRAALYHQRLLGDGLGLHAWLQHASLRRDETLVGFYTVLTPQTLSGYWRELDEHYTQRNAGAGVYGQTQAQGAAHDWQVQWQRNQQSMRFAGPQSVGAFTIDVANPDFRTLEHTPLSLKPRWWLDELRDDTLSLRDRITLSPAWQLHASTAQTRMAIDSASSRTEAAPTTLTAVTRGQWHSHSATLLHSHAQHQQWLSAGMGHEPTRGTQRDGSHLPPVRSQQWEIGWRILGTGTGAGTGTGTGTGAGAGAGANTGGDVSNAPARLHASLWHIDQEHIAGVDPQDKNHLVPIGHVRSQGLSLRSKQAVGAAIMQASWTRQSVRTLTPASANVGPFLAGTPSQWASLHLSWPRVQLRPWAQFQAVSAKPGDSHNTFSAPGYGLVSFGLVHPLNARWQVSAQLHNALDKRYIASLTANDNAYQGPRRKALVELRGGW